jgi:hypothetical protein
MGPLANGTLCTPTHNGKSGTAEKLYDIYIFSWHEIAFHMEGTVVAWLHGSWIDNYLCNQCLSPLILCVRISIRARCTPLCGKVCQWLVLWMAILTQLNSSFWGGKWKVLYRLSIPVLPLEIQLSRGNSWDKINWFKSAIFLFLSQANTWISNVICCSSLFLMLNELRYVIVSFVDIGGIVDQHCLNFVFVIQIRLTI